MPRHLLQVSMKKWFSLKKNSLKISINYKVLNKSLVYFNHIVCFKALEHF